MRVLCIAPFVPFAAMPHAGGDYLYRYLKGLIETAGVEVSLLAPATADNVAARTKTDLRCPIELAPLARSRFGTAERRIRNAALALSPGWPTLAGIRAHPGLIDLVEWCDIVDIEYGYLLPLRRDLRQQRPALPVVATELDVITQTFQRRVDASRGPARIALAAQTRRVAAKEVELLNECDVVRVVSAKDGRLLDALGVRTPTIAIELVGGGSPPISPAGLGRAGPVLFTGALWRHENARSAVWFANEVWPAVRNRVPTAELVIAGAEPPPEVAQLSGLPGVTVTGWVPDLAALYRDAGVFVAPLVLGAGVKVKVLDAMRWGLPVVATTVGAEGIVDVAPDGAFAAVTDDAATFADETCELLEQASRRSAVGAVAQEWMAGRPTFEASLNDSISTYERLVATADHRT